LKYEQGESITVHASNYIDTIKGIRNICKYGDTNYFLEWIEQYGGAPADWYACSIQSSADFSIASVHKDWMSGIRRKFDNLISRSFSNNLHFCIAYRLLDGPDDFCHLRTYSTDDNFATNTEHGIVLGPYLDQAVVVDIIYQNSIYWYIYVHYDQSAGTYILKISNADASTVYTGSTYTGSLHHCFGGGINADGDYEYVDYVGGKYYYNTFDGTANPTQGAEETAFTGITNFNTENQIYWIKGNMKFLMSRDALFIYDHVSSTWTKKTVVAPTDVNGVIWGKNADDELIVKYIFWDDQLWKMFRLGGIASMQTISGIDAYVGNEDWFSTGSAIYQIKG